MTLYLDASALLKLYFSEPESAECRRILASDPAWVTARHTVVEIRRNLARALRGRRLAEARDQLGRDWISMSVVDLTEEVCEVAARIAEQTGIRSLDALHLAAAEAAGGDALAYVTYDRRQAKTARSLGWTVLGA